MVERRSQVDEQRDQLVLPLVYEIRVKGRLDADYWSQWFDGMTVTIDESGDTILRGPVADQSALYGLLARLRDLALPLLSVRLVKSGEQEGVSSREIVFSVGSYDITATRRSPLRRKYQTMGQTMGQTIGPLFLKRRYDMERKPRRVNWLLLLVYLLLIGGMVALIVFLTSAGLLATALAIALLFASLGGIAYAFFLRGEGWGWGAITVINWVSALIAFTVYVTETGLIPTELALAALFFLAAGILLYLPLRRRRSVKARALNGGVQWEPLGGTSRQAAQAELSPAERDVPPPHGDY